MSVMSEPDFFNFYKSPRFWRNLLLQLIILILVYSGFQLWQSRNAITGPAPAINAVLLDGRSVSLAKYAGKPVLVHFWASWCPICRFEESSISAISDDYEVLSFATQSGDRDSVKTHVDERGLRFPVIVDEQGEWAHLYGVRGYPSSFIIDSNGNIFDVEMGYSSGWGLRLRLFLAGL